MKNQVLQLLIICLLSMAVNPLMAQPPINDVCENAFSIICGEPKISGTNEADIVPDVVPTCGLSNTAPGTWFKYTATQTSATAIFSDFDNVIYDIRVSIFSGSCGTLTCVGSSSLGDSELVFPTVVGEDYFILVHGFEGSVGQFFLQLLCEVSNEDPEITCPPDVTIECGLDESSVATGVATGTGTCGGIVINESSTEVAGCGGSKVITRTWTATDACGNSASCDQVITVLDTTAPSINVEASSQTVECDGDGNAAQLAAWLASNGNTGAASDDCGTVSWSYSSPGFSDLCFATGTQTVTFIATDDCGNSSTSTATFTIEDSLSPEVTCPLDITVCADPLLPAGSAVTWTVPKATDICGVVVLFSDHQPGDVFPDGVTVVTYTATDDCGNTTQCTFNVEVSEALTADAGDCQTHYDTEGYAPEAEILNHLTVVAAGGVGPYTYAWSGDGIVTNADQQTISVDPTSDEISETFEYTVVVTDATGCATQSSVQVIYENIVCNNNGKVQVCHYQSDSDGTDGNTLCLPPSAVGNHIGAVGHDDVWGDCANVLTCNAVNPPPTAPSMDGGENDGLHFSAKNLAVDNQLRIFPNPNSGIFTIETDLMNYIISIHDMTGKLISQELSTETRLNIDLGQVDSGIYFVRLQNEESHIIKKILIEH